MAEADMNFCSNCKRHIAAVNYVMHEVHCKRNIVLCEHCEEPVPRSELEDHFEENHAPVECPLCSEKLEKAELEQHKSDTCLKRLCNCHYCELELPFSELSSHQDYCGSRTEQCPLCNQYILQRDQAKHEESMCSYPPPKNNSTGQNNRSQINGENHGHGDTFRLDELSRILNDPGMGRPMPRTRQSTLSSHRNQLGLQRPSRQNQTKPINTRPGNQMASSSSQTRAKRTNEIASQRQKAPKENNQSSQRSVTHSSNLESGDDLDRILAMHLAQDLCSSDGISDVHDVNHFDEFSSHRRRSSSPSSLHGNAITLPCEFCGDPFPMELLISHQSHCNQPTSLEDPNMDTRDSPPRDMEPNNSPYGSTPRSRQGQPRIVDNLSYLAAHDWLTRPGHDGTLEEGEVMLPCEFCDQLFPEDILVQHQAVCEANLSTAPGTPTPTVPQNVVRRQKHAAASNAAAQEPRNTRSTKRQSDPVVSHPQGHGGRVTDHDSPGIVGVRRMSGSRKKTTNMARDGNSNYSSLNSSTRTSFKPAGIFGTNSRDYNVPATNHVHPGLAQPSKTASSNKDNSTSENIPRARAQRRSRAAAGNSYRRRPDRYNLDQMLENPSFTTSDLLSRLDKDTKSQRNQRKKERFMDDHEQNGTDMGDATGNHPSRRSSNRNTSQGSTQHSSHSTHRTSNKSRTDSRRPGNFDEDSTTFEPFLVQPTNSADAASSSSSVRSRRRSDTRPSSRSRRYPQGDV